MYIHIGIDINPTSTSATAKPDQQQRISRGNAAMKTPQQTQEVTYYQIQQQR